MSYVNILTCRTCDSNSLLEILNLGNQPLANGLREVAADLELSYPLRLVQCSECGLVQIDANVDPELMFSNYNWVTGTSTTSVEHCANFVNIALSQFKKRPKSVLEIGSNDGTLLKAFKREKIAKVVGVDPATNLVSNYESGIEGENLFFTSSNAMKLLNKYGGFDIVIARNVFSHIPDFLDVISGVKSLLHNHSIFFMEFHWALEILQGLHYDSIYHEHTYYHSIASVGKVLDGHELTIFDAFNSPISGGSVVTAASLERRPPTDRFTVMKTSELESGVDCFDVWKDFGSSARVNIENLKSLLEEYNGKRICAFGASARSSTILNAIGVQAKCIQSIAENNPRKWGKYSPGIGIPIESPKEMLLRNPSLIILFPFNFKNEIIQQLADAGWSGLVLIPIPHLQLIEI